MPLSWIKLYKTPVNEPERSDWGVEQEPVYSALRFPVHRFAKAPGSIWVEGDDLHYIPQQGREVRLRGDIADNPITIPELIKMPCVYSEQIAPETVRGLVYWHMRTAHQWPGYKIQAHNVTWEDNRGQASVFFGPGRGGNKETNAEKSTVFVGVLDNLLHWIDQDNEERSLRSGVSTFFLTKDSKPQYKYDVVSPRIKGRDAASKLAGPYNPYSCDVPGEEDALGYIGMRNPALRITPMPGSIWTEQTFLCWIDHLFRKNQAFDLEVPD